MKYWAIKVEYPLGITQEPLFPSFYQELASDWIKVNRCENDNFIFYGNYEENHSQESELRNDALAHFLQFRNIESSYLFLADKYPSAPCSLPKNIYLNMLGQINPTCLHAVLWQTSCCVSTNCKQFLKHVRRFLFYFTLLPLLFPLRAQPWKYRTENGWKC